MATNFRRKILPAAHLISLCVCTVFMYLFNLDFVIFKMLIFVNFFALIIYLMLFRNIKRVYLDGDYLLVDNKKLPFEEIVSIKKKTFARYRIYFKNGSEIKFFHLL